jgi:alpha-tubulin suppressor-like RCC1 family protein
MASEMRSAAGSSTHSRRAPGAAVAAPLGAILVAMVMLLVAFSGQAGAQTPGPVQAIAAGDQHALAIVNSPYYGSLVYAWGANWYGQVGDNTSHDNRFPPARVTDPSGSGYLSGVQKIAAGQSHSLALMQDGSMYAWGLNDDCQLGYICNCPAGIFNHIYSKRPIAVDLPAGSQMEAIAAGNLHSLAVRDDGTVWAWGNNDDGQLGIHSEKTQKTPVQVHGPGNAGYLYGVSDVAAGRWHSLALTYGGNVYAWGGNSEYQLGVGSLGTDSNGTELNSDTPVKVEGPDSVGSLDDVKAIAAGYDWNLALKDDGTVWAWGNNAYGQLGVNSNNPHGYPVQVHGPGNEGYLSGITAIAAGERHALAVKDDGTVYSWGGNNHGQLGVNSDNQHPYPVQVHGLGNVGYLSGITDVDAGEFFSMALNSDGTAVYAWGGNSYGQIDATLEDHSYPVQVSGVAASTPPPTPGEKTAICHKPGTPAEKTLYVPPSALNGHLGHGDTLGSCSSR